MIATIRNCNSGVMKNELPRLSQAYAETTAGYQFPACNYRMAHWVISIHCPGNTLSHATFVAAMWLLAVMLGACANLHSKDPLSTFGQRMMSGFIGILPIESQR